MLNPDLTDSQTIKKILAKHHLQPDKSLGQNFLICKEVVEATLTAMSPQTKKVTELGPGMGALTQALTSSGFQVKAIERDPMMAKILQNTLSPRQKKQLDLITDDLRSVDWPWNTPYQLVGNIPYNLSGLIIRGLTKLKPAPAQAIILVQKEVGERLTATVPDMHLITLAVNLWGEAQKIINVPRNCFWPAPKVDSSLVLLLPLNNNPLSVDEREKIMKTAKIFFQNKRKQIGGTMRRSFNLTNEDIDNICRRLTLHPTMRPQELTAQNWHELTKILA